MKNLIINLIVFVLSITITENYAQTLTWLGTLPGYEYSSKATGVSADGSVVVGWVSTASGESRAFRWTAADGMQDLGTLGGDWSYAYGVSADGSVVVGEAWNASSLPRAFRWTASDSMQDLGTLGGDWSTATGVSADGSVVVGSALNVSGQDRAFRWTAADGMQDLSTLGSDYSWGSGVSADGYVVVGTSPNSSGQNRAFRWKAQTGMQDLGTLGGVLSVAFSVSADGSVVVGYARNASDHDRAFLWTATGGMQDLGTLGYDYCWAIGVSADGSVVVGFPGPFRWTAQTGMQDLNQIYAELLQDGSVLKEVQAISPDGRYIVGYGRNAATSRDEAFLLDDSLFITSVPGRNVLPEQFMLYQNYPNPFNPSTSIQYAVGNRQFVQLKVYDILGNEVATLVNEEKAPGIYEVKFNSHSDGGQNLPAGRQGLSSGVYFYKLQAGDFVETKKMILLR